MKSDPTKQGWKPTLTLAKLFEEQNQFFDALAIYEIISQTDQSPELQQKIEALQSRILNDSSLRYDPRIEKLFSPEELAYLRIMSHTAFEHLSVSQAQFMDSVSDYQLLLSEEEEASGSSVTKADLDDFAEAGEVFSEPSGHSYGPERPEPTVEELVQELVRRFGQDSRLSDISVQEFLQLLKDFNLLAGFTRRK